MTVSKSLVGNDHRIRTLVVEDDEPLRELLVNFLEGRGHSTAAFSDAESAWDACRQNAFSIVILDWRLAGRMDGLQLCRNVKASERGELSIVLALTGRNQPEDLRAMLDAGADDYIVKPLDMKIFEVRLTIAERRARDTAFLIEAKSKSGDEGLESFQGMIGKSAKMRDVYRRIGLAAESDIPVLLLGESGAGKELAARAVHDLSRRKTQPFLAVNCSAIPDSLLESELFGHVKGAFTGATQDKIGIFQAAQDGTLFLDEIGDLHPNLQLKLLRVLEQKEIRRLGDSRVTHIDARLVTATNKNLRDHVSSGAIREDFYYRIHGFEIILPPLRDRREDIPLLVNHFLSGYAGTQKKRIKTIAQDALQKLIHHPWPGNVRQLKYAVEQTFVSAEDNRISLADLPSDILHPPESKSISGRRADGPDRPVLPPEQQAERIRIIEALTNSGKSRSMAAKTLGISRISLWRKMKKLEIEDEDL